MNCHEWEGQCQRFDKLRCTNMVTSSDNPPQPTWHEIRALVQERNSLVDSLMKYGSHLHGCNINFPPTPPALINACNCGFASLLLQKEN